jgi:hypothetical protein
VRDDDEGGAALLRELHHRLEDFVRGVRVEVAGGLVGEHAGRLRDESAREGGTLALAPRELGGQVLEALAEADLGERAPRPLERGRPVHAADEKRHRHVLDRGEFRQQVVELVDKPQRGVAHAPALRLVHRAERPALHAHAAGRRCIQPAEQVQQRALARARLAHDRHALARAHGEVHAREYLHRLRPVVGLRQPPAGENRRTGRFTHSAAPRRD